MTGHTGELLSGGVRRALLLLGISAVAQSLAVGQIALAGDNSAGNFGGVGLLDMPTARFEEDGMLSLGGYYNTDTTRLFVSWQATPWLETTLSYTDEQHPKLELDRSLDLKIRLLEEGNFLPALAVGFRDMLGSGKYGAEYIVANKRFHDFDFTFGFGWGNLSTRGGFYNVLRVFGDGFDQRNTDTGSGDIPFGSYFAGQDMAVFAGVQYQTPIDGLSLKMEFSSLDTDNIPHLSHLKDKSPVNFGLNYRPASWIDLAVGYDYGDRVSFRLVLKTSLHSFKLADWSKGRDPVPVHVREGRGTSSTVQTEPTLALENDRTFDRLKALGFRVLSVSQEEDDFVFTLVREETANVENMTALGAVLLAYPEATLEFPEEGQEGAYLHGRRNDELGRTAIALFERSDVYLREQASRKLTDAAENRRLADAALRDLKDNDLAPLSVRIGEYRAEVVKNIGPYAEIPRNAGRTARILTSTMPDQVELFDVISMERGLEISRLSLMRKEFEKAANYQGSPEEILVTSEINNDATAMKEEQVATADAGEGAFEWDILPEVTSHFGSISNDKFKADLYATLLARYSFYDGLDVMAEVRQKIVGNLEDISPRPDDNVPAVRSDIGRYVDRYSPTLKRIQFNYIENPLPDLYTRVTAGLFESMYGGVGAEVLYKRRGSSWAVGGDLNWAKQRDYEQLFDFRDYDTVTGHVSLYHENSRYNISTVVRAGRYLAGDWGATFDISRRFDNGIRIGLFATVTDMSSEDFGDGSFDKGIYMKIPFGLFWYKPSRHDLEVEFRALGRDGGQRLDRGTELYEILSAGERHRLEQDWRHILD
ncbi:YjbH domain-containing protein [Emcibacter nanhaiensis]|uniref:YjbH domain-containing protein n=1 Tax=Emcibacter nanhaiensis TaxID=1505037 RepID=A0A501PHC5_9PROT|nr:YjbH domain-containing protein [Emcibacter nanhaiensis]